MKRYFLTLVLSFGSLGELLLFAQPGVCDPSFNVVDDCTYGSGESFNDRLYAMALQSDGKILTGGDFTIYNGVGRNRIARLNPDGTLDQNFNPGTGFSDIFNAYNPVSVQALAIQSDGKILAGGNFQKYDGNIRRGIVRLNADGSLDKSFNIGSGFDAPVYKLVIQPDGKVLAVGSFTTYKGVSRNRIARLNTDGSLDTTFKVGTGFNNYVRTITLLSNGKMYVGGIFNSYNGTTSVCIARLKSDGSFDAAFATGSGFMNEVTSILAQTNGKIIASGHFGGYKGTFITRIIRIDSNGNYDNTFNPGAGFDAGVYSAALQSDGKVIVGGAYTKFNNKSVHKLCRLNTNGSIDTTFKTELEYIVGEVINTVLIQADGKVLIGGKLICYSKMNRLNSINRLENNGTYDHKFNHGTGFQVAEVAAFIVQPDDKIIAGGTFYSYNGTQINAIARLNDDGTLDTTFKSGANISGNIETMSRQSDGKIIFGGGVSFYNGKPLKYFARLNTDGSLDTTFRAGAGSNSTVYSTAIQSDGKIVVVGNFTIFNDTTVNRIVRLNTNGTIDTSFKMGTGFDQIVYKVFIQPDGKILVGGRFTKYKNKTHIGIIRLLPNGDVDSTFVTGTGINTAFPSTGLSFLHSINMQSDGKIILVGNFKNYNGNSKNGIVRILPNGRNDSTFQLGSGFDNFVYDVIIQSDGKIVTTGRFTTYRGQSRKGIMRLMPDGSPDNTFNPGTGFDRYTRALAFHKGERILVGGDFTNYNGACRTRIARLFGCETLSKDVRVSCGPYTWKDGKKYESSTNAPYIEYPNANSNGCDSFVLLNLTVNNPKFSEQTIKACGSYKWINGITYTASNDTAKHIIPGGASNGCDSTITLKLTINQPTSSIDGITACKKYKWIDGITYTASNNTAKYTYVGGAYNGCDSVVTLSLGIINVTTTVSKNLTVLTSNEFSAVYQWLDCDDGNKPIPGATDRTFEPDSSGNYAVVVTKNGCTDTSDCIEVEVDNSSINNISRCSSKLYPSPSNGKISIEPGKNCALSRVVITDQLGRNIRTIEVMESGLFTIELQDLKGIYFVELIDESGARSRYKILME